MTFTKSIRSDLLIVTFFSLILFAFMLGSRPLSAPDEGRYSEIPREMVESGEYVTPKLNGVKYFEKPPMMYWLGSLSVKLFGVNEWALRFWPAFLGFLTVLATYFMGVFIRSSYAGFCGSLMLASSILFYAHTRLLILDMAVAAFITLGLYCFFVAYKDGVRFENGSENNKNKKTTFLCLMGFFVFSAFAVLSKGLIGVVLPGSIIVLFSIFSKNIKPLKMAFNPLGILVFLLIALPWHLLAMDRNPEFFDFYIVHEHFTRYLEKVHNRYQPFWFFVPILLVGLFPWTFLIINRFVLLFKKPGESLFFLIWISFVFCFFSFSNSKLIPYIVPIFPPLCLLAGISLSDDKSINGKNWTYYALFGLSLSIALALPFIANQYGVLQDRVITFLMCAIMSCLFAVSYFSYKMTRLSYDFKAFFIRILCVSAVFLSLLNGAWPYLDTRSVKVFAQHINAGDKNRPVVAFGRYYQDLTPYVGRKVIVVDWQGELDFGMRQEDTSAWMMSGDAFFAWHKAHENAYIVTRKDFLPRLEAGVGKKMIILQETDSDVLVVSQ